MKKPPHLIPVMNNTKWDELRLGMYELEPEPEWRTKCWENGYITPWDFGWYYHFREGGYRTAPKLRFGVPSGLRRLVTFAAAIVARPRKLTERTLSVAERNATVNEAWIWNKKVIGALATL
ncbi:hypothetical protein KJ975_14195, partial [Myxococcota bacterium]|nr:hypothetical protein [Myxococcota bacterium]